jgi:hypothetical protein
MRNHLARWFTLLVAMLALALLASPRPAVADDDDPPNRAARLSYSGGSVSFEPGGTDDWVDAVVNRPMTTGDRLWTDRDGRAEIRVDSYGLRMGPMTGFSFLNLDDNTVQVRLTEGSLNVRVRRMDDDQTLEIDTPNLAFNILRPGSYRIDVNENGDSTVVSVQDGQGEVTGGGSAYPIHAGQSATFQGTDDLYADIEGYPREDDFDRWCRDRDRRWDRSGAARYVSDDVVGYEDLDEYGGWRSVPEYGTVWFPHTTVVGWAPYRYGHWVWISPWGWTWVDDAPWGFAPFHYGRWITVGGVWGWVPSPPRPAVMSVAYVRPVYAPALVAFVGGSRYGVGVSVGSVGAGVAWFPLGPRDVYCPSYHVSPRYVERVNVSNTVIVNRTQVTNVYNNVYVNKTVNVTNVTYQNQRATNAVTATSQASFTSAQPVGRNMVRVDAREVASAPVAPMTPTVAPQQRSFTGGAAQARVRPPANVVARSVVAKTAPPPAPVPVAKQMQQVQANGGRPLSASQIRQAQPDSAAARPNVKVAAPAKQATLPPAGQGGNKRPGQPGQPPVQTQQNEQTPGRPANQPPNQPAVQPNANRPPNQNPGNANPNNANRPNPNQPNANPNNPNANPNNANRPNPNQPNANPNNPNANPNNPNRANPNQPNVNPNKPNANENNPNANRPGNNRSTNDRPPASRPSVDPKTQERQQQQLDKLRQQQDQERQKVEQRQVQQQQKMEQQKANEQRQQQIQKQQQQQLEQMERKHDQQQQKMEQNQAREAQKQQQQQQKQQQQQNAKPPKNEKPRDNKDHPPPQ